MKRVLKSSLSLILAITIILGSAYVGFAEVKFDGLFAVEAKAEGAEENTVEVIEKSEEIVESEDTTEDYVYYSELFYGYPYYLANDTYFQAYVGVSNGIYNSVHESYQNSSLVIGTGIEHALDIVTSPTEIAKLITDTYGLTDFSYNDALDAANEAFVANMMSDTLAYSTQKSYGKVAKYNKQLNTLVTYFNKLNVTDTFGGAYTAEDVVYDAYKYLWDKGCLSFISEEMLFQLWEEISSDSFSLNSCFELAKNEIDIAMAIVTALMMENIRLELIEDVIALQTSDTVLKQGMVRLRDKLRGGFVSYFIENYLLKKLADDLFGVVDKVLVSGADAVANGSITSAELKALVAVAKKVFNYVVEVPKFDEVLKWQVLIAYSYDISETIKNKATSFTTGPFLSDEILKYENYFLLYDAVNKATMAVTSNIARMLDPFGNAYTVLEEARVNNISEVTITSGANSFPISSSTTEEELRAILIADTYVAATTGNVYALLKDVKISNGIRTEKITRKANGIGSVVRGCVSENIDLIYAFNQACSGVSLYEEHISNVLENVKSLSKEERINILEEAHQGWVYDLDNNLSILQASDTIISNCIYAVDGVIWGSINVNNYANISSNVEISGNLSFNKTSPSGLNVAKNVVVTIHGNVHADVYSMISSKSGMEIQSGSKVNILGDFIVKSTSGCTFVLGLSGTLVVNGDLTATTALEINQNENSYLKICGNFTRGKEVGSFYAGTLEVQGDYDGKIVGKGTHLVVLNSNKPQTINNLNAQNLRIENTSTEGVSFTGTSYVAGKLRNENSNLNNGKSVYLNGGTFEGTRYNGDIRIMNGVTIKNNIEIIGDVYFWEDSPSCLNVAKNVVVTIHGSVHADVYSMISSKGGMEIQSGSKVNILGDFIVKSTSGCTFVLGLSGTLVVNGDLTATTALEINQNENSYLKICGNFTRGKAVGSFNAGVLEVQGDCDGRISGGSKYTVILSGSQLQNISNLTASTIIINNSKGVKFNSAIKPTTLFNHNGNPFTLYNNGSGSTFADFDYDGLKDNIDPEPTVGNPCTITIATENVEKGTVSESFDSVGGTSVTVCAEPTFKYNFYCWKNASGSIVSYNSNYTFVAKGDTKLTAYFTKRQRNITVKTENGTLTVPSKAEIESTVTVTPVPNEGCLYTADSIIVNGEAITGNSFIMPDEDVTLSAHFCVNDYYFALKDVLTEAKEIDQTLYLTETVDVLQTAIENAQNSLVNEISQEESDARILELQTAMKNLILVTGTCGGSLTWSYDEESKTLTITGTGEMYDYTDSDSPWECLECKIQNVSISRGITSIGNAAFNNCSVLTDVYYGYTEENWNSLSIGTNNEYLISANIHCHVHNFLGTVTINATCIEDGEKTYNCDCGDVYIENIDALGHDYSTEWTIDVAVTCTEDGIKSHHCSRCAEKTDITVISATGHSYSDEWTIDVAPTCTQEGSKSHHCVNCEDYTDVTVVNALGHDYGDWNVTLEATCTVEGNKHKICLICDDTVSEVIPAKGHSYSTDWTIDVAPTCTEDGSKSHHCTGCDDMIDIIVIMATGHNISNDICISCGYGDVWGYELYADYAVITDYNGDKANVVIPDSIAGLPVRTIGNTVFDGYSNLVSITIPDSVTSIGSFTFRKCTNLISITIPDKMEKISSYAFYGCTGLTSIVVPKSLLNVGVSAFTKCSNLKYVFYTGAEPDWANIKISNNNSAFINAVVHFNSTGHNYVIQGAENIHPHTIAYKCSVCEDITEETPILSDCDECIEEIKGLVQETINAEIDYENFIIYTNVENCNDVTAFLSISESFVAVTEASYVYGNCEFYGTGTIITVFDGNEYVGDFTLVVNGDTNGDSVCDALDAAQVALVSNGQKTIDGAYKMAADSNSDDIVDIEDYQAIVNKVVA